MDIRLVVCVKCGGRQFMMGIQPRRQSRDEMEQDLREKGKIHAICRHCGEVSTLKAANQEAAS